MMMNIIGVLREYDLKSKGYETGSSGQNEWHKEMLFKKGNDMISLEARGWEHFK